MSDTAAACHCGIPASTLSRWKFLNPELELRFLSAREDFRLRQVYQIQTATTRDGRRDWRAAAWLLERIFPEDYARRPGRRVNPASENQTWLDEARANDAAGQHERNRRNFEKLFSQDEKRAREAMLHPDWDRADGNVGCLPGEEYLTAESDPITQLPPSYAAYAEATEQALRQSTRVTPPTPATPPTAAAAEDRLPLHPHLPLPQQNAAPSPTLPTTPEPSDPRLGEAKAGSEITETPPLETASLSAEPARSRTADAEPPRAPAAPPPSAAAEGRTQASPRPASVTSAALGTHPINSRPEVTAQESVQTTRTTSEITETLLTSCAATPNPEFQNYQNSPALLPAGV
jgi:hypothetical protein